ATFHPARCYWWTTTTARYACSQAAGRPPGVRAHGRSHRRSWPRGGCPAPLRSRSHRRREPPMEPIEHTTQQLHFPTSEPPTQDHAAPPTVALTVPVPSAPPAPPPQPPAARPTATRGRTTISDDV